MPSVDTSLPPCAHWTAATVTTSVKCLTKGGGKSLEQRVGALLNALPAQTKGRPRSEPWRRGVTTTALQLHRGRRVGACVGPEKTFSCATTACPRWPAAGSWRVLAGLGPWVSSTTFRLRRLSMQLSTSAWVSAFGRHRMRQAAASTGAMGASASVQSWLGAGSVNPCTPPSRVASPRAPPPLLLQCLKGSLARADVRKNSVPSLGLLEVASALGGQNEAAVYKASFLVRLPATDWAGLLSSFVRSQEPLGASGDAGKIDRGDRGTRNWVAWEEEL